MVESQRVVHMRSQGVLSTIPIRDRESEYGGLKQFVYSGNPKNVHLNSIIKCLNSCPVFRLWPEYQTFNNWTGFNHSKTRLFGTPLYIDSHSKAPSMYEASKKQPQ